MKKLLFSVIATVLIEIAVFIVVGKNIGVFNTLLLILFTSVIGIWVAKKQGVQSVQNMRNSMAESNPPGPAMIDTFLIFVGGILLVLPGFLTDLLGFMLVIPFTRKLFKPAIYQWLRKKMNNGQVFIIHK
ncbi:MULTISPECIES: FxsA family protein [Lysinibacillus]|uniref:FxsA family protein n=1 Tax=Lysinibacillus antri TaxID=2498145 RepID=A0A3S0WID1_9BACI|nr:MULTISPECIES: FxsA family protein [Lysinibacillus]RUL56419.1 FxsA family protein [Lysinibacillus antri]TSI03110.1 FxsA family protein [Lysinibacillus sp. BW-2-10]